MRKLLYLLLVILMAGCAQVPVKDEAALFAAQEARLSALKHWSLNGRFAIQYQGDGGSGIIRWQRNDDNYDLRLYDAIGRMQLHLWRKDGLVRMQSREGEAVASETAEQLMQAQLGWSLPLAALDYWVRGLEAPDLAVSQYETDGLYVQRVVQDQWMIDYSRHELVNKLWVPGMIRIQGQDISLKIIVEQWNLS